MVYIVECIYQPFSPRPTTQMDDVYIIDKILKTKWVKGVKMAKIEWNHFPMSQATSKTFENIVIKG